MRAIAEKGGGTFQGIKLLLCEDPLPPMSSATVVRISVNWTALQA